MNAVIDNILTRRSIRAYQTRQIKEEDLNVILQAAQYAPSGSNNQLWRFTVLQNQETLQTLNAHVREGFCAIELEEDAYPAKRGAKNAAQSDAYNFYYHAPTLIIVSNLRSYPNAMADSAAALENIFLAAHSLDIGSCWINQLTWLGDEPQVRKVLTGYGIPADHMICGAASLGYARNQPPAALPRKEGTVHILP